VPDPAHARGGGIATGLGLLLLLPIAAAGMIGVGRVVLFQAALATLGVLVEHSMRVLWLDGDPARFLHAGLLSLGFFTMAWASQILSRKASASEQLAETRGEQLEILAGINRHIIQELQDGVMIVDETGRMLQATCARRPCSGRPGVRHTCRRSTPGSGRPQPGGNSRPNTTSPSAPPPLQRNLRPRFMSADRTQADYAVILLEDTGDVERQAAQLARCPRAAYRQHRARDPQPIVGHHPCVAAPARAGCSEHPRLLEIIEDNALRMDVLAGCSTFPPGPCQPGGHTLQGLPAALVEEFAAYEKVPDRGIRLMQRMARCARPRPPAPDTLNLLRNAWRHCRRQTGSIRVHAAPAHTPGMIQIDVMDDGPACLSSYSLSCSSRSTTESRGTASVCTSPANSRPPTRPRSNMLNTARRPFPPDCRGGHMNRSRSPDRRLGMPTTLRTAGPRQRVSANPSRLRSRLHELGTDH
jgi:two-component system sensor histidine kinase PilS (NtrC family)